ncbi:MAG TPA: hypothetical protein PLD47_13675 [Aggregatilineales bacterium]|nr:hypothetical protein [Anaerolineales bacterium]HRE48770.1 hypothetical protein [Aggregatilineales bacterium]
MDANQLSRMIEWLDEERRRDKAKIAKMEEQLTAQQDVIELMSRRVNTLETENVSLRSNVLPAGRDTEMMDQFRDELRQALEAADAKRITAEREAERRAEIARESLLRPVRDLMERIDKIERLQDDLAVARVERDRMVDALGGLQQGIDDLNKRLEEPDRRIAFLEEQRRNDTRRATEVQDTLNEYRKQIDALRPKFDLIEALALKNERLILDLQGGDRERAERVQTFLDQQALAAQQRDARVEEIRQGFAQYEEDMRRRMERFEMWAEAYRQMKKIIEDFERIADRLDKRINETAEMQRLAEKNFREDWDTWQTDETNRWKRFTDSYTDQWRIHDRSFEELRGRVNDLTNQFPPMLDHIDRLWKFQRGMVDTFRDRLMTLLSEFDQQPVRTVTGGIRNTQPMRPVDGK